jgi:outer membrane protein assembly factor BamB
MFHAKCSFALLLGLASVLTLQQVQLASANDWPSWRGPYRSGIAVDETGLQSEWSDDGPELKWQIDGLGRGYSSIAISDGRIFTMGKRKSGCELIAFDLNGGRELWAISVRGGNPNCTPTVDGGLVYALGRDGHLVAADVATGKIAWQKDFPKDFGGSMMSGWGYSESPLIDGDRLVCTPGAKDAVVVALDKRTGETIWKSVMPDIGKRGKDGAGYSSIVISHARDVKQYIQLTGRGVISIDAESGKQLWAYNRIANGTANISTPLVKGDSVFCSTGYGTGAALLQVVKEGNELVAKEKYFLDAKKMQNHHGGMIVYADHIYCGHGHNNGFPLCINFLTGEEVWSGGRGPGGGSAAILLADGHLYFRYEDGTMALIEATSEEYRLKGSFKLATKNGKSWPHPVIVDGLLYARDQNALLCYDIRK